MKIGIKTVILFITSVLVIFWVKDLLKNKDVQITDSKLKCKPLSKGFDCEVSYLLTNSSINPESVKVSIILDEVRTSSKTSARQSFGFIAHKTFDKTVDSKTIQIVTERFTVDTHPGVVRIRIIN